MSWLFERPACRLSLALALALPLGGCGQGTRTLDERPVPPGAFALVGGQSLGQDLLLRSARERDVASASQALISDALVALDSSEQMPERAAAVQRGLLVRGLIDHLRQEALERSPVQSQELDLAAKALWAELDRPRCVRTVNIVASVAPLTDGEQEERVMRRIAQAVRGAMTTDELALRVDQAPKEGLNVAAFFVPPLTEDGRVYAQTPTDAAAAVPPVEYARAAARLTYAGETSDVVSTSAGYHVLMAIDILPPASVSEPERTERLRTAVADRRIEPELDRLRRELSVSTNVWRNPHSAALTSLVWRAQSAQDQAKPGPSGP
jgi:hypothetical protein